MGKESFIQRRRAAFDKFQAKRKERSGIKQARASIKRKSEFQSVEQKLGRRRKIMSEKLAIAKEKAELKALKRQAFEGSFAGKSLRFAQRSAAKGRQSRVLRGTVLSSRRSPVRRRKPMRRKPMRKKRQKRDTGIGLVWN